MRLDGGVAISDCLVEAQDGGELGQVGEGMVAAATELNRRAQDDPAGDATIQLGYLVGAVQEAASDDRRHPRGPGAPARLRGALQRGRPGLGAAFERAFGEGYAAGQAYG